MKVEVFAHWFIGAYYAYERNNKFNNNVMPEHVRFVLERFSSGDSPEQLAYFINGYYEQVVSDNAPVTTFDKNVIEHLKLVFHKKTPVIEKPLTKQVTYPEMGIKDSILNPNGIGSQIAVC
jgi:hypothetical protein